jgi:hypothetical protein
VPLPTSSCGTVRPDDFYRTIGGEPVVLNLKTELYLGPDPLGTRMWTASLESGCIWEAYEKLLPEYEEANRPREYLGQFLFHVQAHRLIELAPRDAPVAPELA